MSVRTRASSPRGTLIQSGTLANRPAAGVADSYYWATDIYVLYRDTGVAWEVITAQPFGRFEYTCNWTHPYISGYLAAGGNVGSIANRLFVAPVLIRHRFTVMELGMFTGTADTGNVMLGLYDHVADRPTNLQCGTVATAIAGLATRLVWIAPTTLPTLPAGFYWVGGIPSVTKTNADGFQFKTHVQLQSDGVGALSWTDGEFAPSYLQDVGAFNLPDPMVPVQYSGGTTFGFAIKFAYV